MWKAYAKRGFTVTEASSMTIPQFKNAQSAYTYMRTTYFGTNILQLDGKSFIFDSDNRCAGAAYAGIRDNGEYAEFVIKKE